jgi:predicted neuraminidase
VTNPTVIVGGIYDALYKGNTVRCRVLGKARGGWRVKVFWNFHSVTVAQRKFVREIATGVPADDFYRSYLGGMDRGLRPGEAYDATVKEST